MTFQAFGNLPAAQIIFAAKLADVLAAVHREIAERFGVADGLGI